MIFDNLEVKHKTFGNGIVTAVNGKYMTVRFEATQKTFVYPDAFENFLTLANGLINEEIQNDIQLSKEEKQRIINKKNEENLRAMTHGIVIPGKEITQGENDDPESNFKQNETEEI